MADNKTLYIVGAGASNEVNLPTGQTLKEIIASLVDVTFQNDIAQTTADRLITSAIRTHIHQQKLPEVELNSYLLAASRIHDAMPQAISIDNFIDIHSNDKKIELCGKIAIVRSILASEGESLLYISDSNIYNRLDFQPLENTWYVSLMKLLTQQCHQKDLAERLKSIAFIVFNYDRCIEHFLYNSLQNYYGMNADEASKLVKEIEIYHPYGVVGSLPWQDGNSSIAFGAEPKPEQLLTLASQIKTFTEGTDSNTSNISAIRNNVAKAKLIVFLGFAFHELNMELMLPDSRQDQARDVRCFATAYNISKSDCVIIKRDIVKLCNIPSNKIIICNDLKCHGLFDNYGRSLKKLSH